MLWLSAVVALGSALVSSVVAANGLDGPVNGTVHTYPLFNCNDESFVGEGNFWSLPPDDCLKVSTSTSFRILEPALCPNGTRAHLARYEGRDCNDGNVTVKGGLANITNDDINTCQSISPRGFQSDEDHASIASFGFYCDGRKAPRPEDGNGGEAVQKTGSISFNNCPEIGEPPLAPTFEHPPYSTCNHILKGNKMKIFHPAVCPDGTDGKFATWYGTTTCEGDFDEIKDVEGGMLRSCFTVSEESHSSFAFLCKENLMGDGVRSRGVLQGGVALLFVSFWLFVFTVSPIS